MSVEIDEQNSDITAGGGGSDGDLVLLSTDGSEHIRLEGAGANAWIGGNGVDGDLVLFSPTGDNATQDQASIHLNGGDASISAGGHDEDGDLVLRGGAGTDRIRLDGGGANAWIGGNGVDGDLALFPLSGDNVTQDQASIHLNGGSGSISAGGQGQHGDLVLRSSDGANRIRLHAGGADLFIGGNGVNGDLALFPVAGDNVTLDQATIRLNGGSGDIILSNADCAEDFEVEDPLATKPGTVMVITEDSRLRVCEQAYDRRVAGVIAGAGDHRPGIVLGRGKSGMGRRPVALVGRVLCKVDADYAAVDLGDMLTTSPSPGCAMKASDRSKSFGAVIGKALRGLPTGTGMIPILIALQ